MFLNLKIFDDIFLRELTSYRLIEKSIKTFAANLNEYLTFLKVTNFKLGVERKILI